MTTPGTNHLQNNISGNIITDSRPLKFITQNLNPETVRHKKQPNMAKVHKEGYNTFVPTRLSNTVNVNYSIKE